MSKFSMILMIVLAVDLLIDVLSLGVRSLWSELKVAWNKALEKSREPVFSRAEAIADVRAAAGKLAVVSSLDVVLFVTLWLLWDLI